MVSKPALSTLTSSRGRMKREALSLTRREFLMCGPTIGLAQAARLEVGSPWDRFFLSPITPSVSLGCLFPSLALLRKIDASRPGPDRFVHVSQPNGSGRLTQRTIEIAFIFPGWRRREDYGSLEQAEQSFLRSEILSILQKDFAHRVQDLKLDPGPSFWYPFLERRVIFCRLTIGGKL